MESRQPLNILLVDDQPAKLLSYESILSELGENLIKAKSATEALECLLKNEIAIVLVDACMPEMDGFELTSMIRNHPRFQKTYIILVSGLMIDDVDRLKGYVSGAVDYVPVPIVPEILRAKVSVFLELYRKTQALERMNQELEERVKKRTAALSETSDQLARAYEASHFLAWIVESSTDAIIGQSLDGTIRTWNAGAESLYGFKSDEVLGKNISSLIPADRTGEASAILEKLLRAECAESFETVRLRKDGAGVQVSMTMSVIRDATGRLIGASQVARDITEQKRTAELMVQTQKLESLGVLAGGVAHDFNNLLVGILGNSSLALDLLPPDSPARPMVEGVLAAAENAAGLTRQMLAYSGKGQFVMSRIDLSQHVRQVLPLIQAAVSRAIEIRLDLADDLPAIEADETQVRQVVMNLAINGAEAIPAGRRGIVTITTRPQQFEAVPGDDHHDHVVGELKPGRYVILEIRDNGSGMDEVTKARIFEPFFTSKFTGRGLGLAAVLGIVRGHSGCIQISSVPGEGSVFRIFYPALPAAVERHEMVVEPVRNLAGEGVVLIIDDEQIVRTVAKKALERYGYTALLAEDKQRGIDVFRRHTEIIQCVVLDATMPGMSGEETLSVLKSVSADVPVLLSSGFSEFELLRKFGGRGVAGFLQKPYTISVLLQKITDVVASRGASHKGLWLSETRN